MSDIFEQYPVGRWVVGDFEIRFPVVQITDAAGNRLIKHERPFRNGAKLDDTGSQAQEWDVEIAWNNSIDEPGLEGNPRLLYPFMLRQFIKSLGEHQTGELTLPTVGVRRCRLESIKRVERTEERDQATTTCHWVEDNEDSVDRTSLRPPTVRASAVKLASQTQFSAQAAGGWDDDLSDLTEFASDVEGLLLAPGRAIDDITSQVRRNRRAIQRIQNAQEKLAEDVDGTFNDPSGSEPVRQLRALSDRQALAADEKTASRPRTKTFTVPEDTTIYGLAALVGQDAEELLELNSARVDDPFDIREGDTVRIFERAA